MTLREIDDLLSDLINKIKVDKRGKIKYDDFHEAVMQVRIKIAKADK